MMEELIDKAQRLKLRPDVELKLELQQMKKLRDQTFDDLQTFVKNREKFHWRKWDKWKYVNDVSFHSSTDNTFYKSLI
jgi:hypothetical protein